MFRQWLATRKSLVATATSGTLIAALIATVAIVSTGFTAQHLDLGDGSVWVANGQKQVIGRANTQVLALDTVVASSGVDIDVEQSGSTVLLVDRTNSKVDIVDAATSKVLDSVPLPPQVPEVLIAGDNVVVGSGTTGQFWIMPLSQLKTFDAQSQPTLSLGANTIVSMTPDGVLFAYSAQAHQVYRVDAAHSDAVDRTDSARLGGENARLAITSVGGHWALLDAANRTMLTDSGKVSLATKLPQDSAAVLQKATTGGDSVLVSYSGGLLRVPLSGSAATSLTAGQTGAATPPVVVDGCTLAAWSGGAAWRRCGTSEPSQLQLQGVPATASRLAFVSNGDHVVLNDPRGGATWAVQQDGELIDNWSDLIAVHDDQQQVVQNNEDTPPEYEKTQVAPIAVNDQFGARPGRTSVLPALLNDYDPNGDVIVITEVTPIDASIGRLDLINEQQQAQLTLAPNAKGTISIGYSISDGRGGTASATISVTVRSPEENSAPQQVRQSTALVATDSRVTTSVLGDWVDPDGDAFYLASAATAAPDSVSWKPDGIVVFSDHSGGGGGLRTVSVVMSDGKAEGTGGLAVTVKPAGQVPIHPDPFIALARAGEEITLRPLDHVRGGTGTLRLASVPDKTGVTITASLEAGTFRFQSSEVGTHYLDYVVNDGDQTATGVVRVDVAAPDTNTKPITIPKTIFVKSLSSETIDVASSDIDPAGGVLLVTGVYNVPPNSGVRAEVIEQRSVRVTLTAPLDAGPVSFNYRISNGLAEAEGVVTVVEIPAPARLQPPIANDDNLTVRVGDAIDIPVLDNDSQPDGEELTLNPQLSTTLSGSSGLLFVSGNVLRYLAPQKTGDFTAIYEVSAPDGQVAQAQVKIAVREAVEATNNPPVPVTITSRVLAGEKVRISIPLSGIDPDGDSVQFLGQATSPDKGSVIDVGPDYIDFLAGEYSAGTDSFSYTVVDALGARATGLIRVGISPRLDGARNPLAVEDVVTIRPGGTVSVQALANDSDPDGSTLKIVSVAPNKKDVIAVIDGDIVKVTPPKKPDRYGVAYTIENAFGGTSQNFITVIVSADAPRAYPVVRDTVVTLTDILGRNTVDATVLKNVFFSDGEVSSVGVALLPGYNSSATVLANKRIRVHVQQKSQIIPFAVSNPEDASIVSYGFLRVPGLDDALPQLNRKAPPLIVTSESQLSIDLDQYVLAIGGKSVKLTDTSHVQATHSNGAALTAGDHTLRFTSADKYFGPASISFEVTDGASATDPAGHVATLVLSITVTPRTNQPPVFIGGEIDFEPAQSKEIDLAKLTNYPHPKDAAELAYTVLGPLPTGFSYTLTGQILVLRANEDAKKNSTSAISIGVRDDLSSGQAGRIDLNIVASGRPLAQPAPDTVLAPRGQTSTVDVLANDDATNPFPGKSLRVVAIRGLDGGSLPTGLSVSPSNDNRRLTIAVSNAASPGDTALQYQVADATGDSDRFVWGSVTVSVQDKPDPISGLRVTGFADRSIQLAWNAAQDNNSNLTGYDVTVTRVDTGAVYGRTTCQTTSGCSVDTPGNGQQNKVRIAVTASNAIGTSLPTSLADAVWSDIIPAAPTGLGETPLDHGLRVTWTKPGENAGSAISSYVVTVGGISQTVAVTRRDPVGTMYTRSIVDPSIGNGSAVAFSVSSRNDANGSIVSWNQAAGTGIPAGAPSFGSAPTAGASVTDGTTASLAWGNADRNGGKDLEYFAAVYTGQPPTCVVSGVEDGDPVLSAPGDSDSFQHVGGATSASFHGLSANTSYTFAVFAYNRQGCTMSAEVTATPRSTPGTVTDVAKAGPNGGAGNTHDFSLSGFTIASGSTDADRFIYKLSGTGVDGSVSGLSSLGDQLVTSNGSHYGVRVSVQVKACKTYPEGLLCSDNWSDAFDLGVPVNNSALGGQQFTEVPGDGADTPTVGTYSWTSSPRGDDYSAVTFSCDGGQTQTPLVDGVGASCAGDAAASGSYTPLTITITANGTEYVRTYQSFDFH